MTRNPYASIVLDASALAASDLTFEMKAKTLRTAVHVGVQWIMCPTDDAQTMCGRALFDLTRWRAIAPIGPEDGRAALFAASLKLRRNRIDLVSIPDPRCTSARVLRDAVRDGIVGGAALGVADAGDMLAALRFPGACGVILSETFDQSGWRDPSVPAVLTSRRGIDVFAPTAQAGASGVTGLIHAPDSPKALFRLLRDYRPRQPAPLSGLAEAA